MIMTTNALKKVKDMPMYPGLQIRPQESPMATSGIVGTQGTQAY